MPKIPNNADQNLNYGSNILEPELKPEFVTKMNKQQKEGTVKVKDFEKHFGLCVKK
jgi:hypothetical protein